MGVVKEGQGLARWLSGQRLLSPILTTCASVPGPTKQEERTNFLKLCSELYTCQGGYTPIINQSIGPTVIKEAGCMCACVHV